MTKRTKGWLIAAVSLILVGCILIVGVMSVLNWDFKKLSTVKYETNTHTITESFSAVAITVDAADVTFAPSEDGTVSVVCYEESAYGHTVAVVNDTLIVETPPRQWYAYSGIDFCSPTVTVYLPAGEYGNLTVRTDTGDVALPIDFTFGSMDIAVTTGDVNSFAGVVGDAKIHTTTGDINLKSLNAGSLDLSVSTGDISVKNVSVENMRLTVVTGQTAVKGVFCRDFTSEGTTGDLHMQNVLATGAFSIKRTTGDVNFDACDAVTLQVTTSTGDILGTLRTQKTFVTDTSTGNVRLPHTAPSGGLCELTTTTGNIYIRLSE